MVVQTTWLTRKQVAERTGFAEKTLENWARAKPPKGPPCFRVGRACRYLTDDVRAWQNQYQQQRAAA